MHTTVPWRYKIVTRQTVPILMGLVGVLGIFLALGYFYTREQILSTIHAQMHQFATSVNKQDDYNYQWMKRFTPALTQTIQRNLLRLPFSEEKLTEEVTKAMSNARGHMEVRLTTILPFSFAASNAPDPSQVPHYLQQAEIRTYTQQGRTAFITLPTGQNDTQNQESRIKQSAPLSTKAQTIDVQKILQMRTPHWSPPQIHDDRTLFLEYITPLKNSQNTVYGTLSIGLNIPTFMGKRIRSLTFFKQCIPFFLTAQGQWSLPPLADASLHRLKEQILKNNKQLHTVYWEDVRYVVVALPSEAPSLFIGVLIPYDDVFGYLHTAITILSLLALLALILAAYGLRKTSNNLLHPLGNLAHMAERLGQGKVSPQELMQTPDQTNITAETNQLLATTQQLRSALQQRMRDLTVMAHTQERMDGELALARTIQNSLRPATLPQGENIAAAAYVHAAREVCGDMYDCFPLSEHEVCCVIGNVPEHGVPAALLTNRIMPLLHELMLAGHSPSSALYAVNRDFDTRDPHKKALFISSFVGILHTQSGLFHWASAGQIPPFLLSQQHNNQHIPHSQLPWSKNVPLGIREQEEYSAMTLQLKPMQTLLFIPQRVLSVPDSMGKGYGEAGLSAFFSTAPSDPDAILSAFFTDIERYTEGNLHDDIVLFALQWKGKK